MKTVPGLIILLALSSGVSRAGDAGTEKSPEGRTSLVPSPAGIYVLDDAANEKPTAVLYAPGLFASSAYRDDIRGHAIFVPIAKILPVITTWGEFNWDWRFLDTLVRLAVGNGKRYSIELETGFQSSGTYLESLPSGFHATAGANSAPLFDVWTTGGGAGRCISAYVLLPWVPKVQQFWSAAATALSAHLKAAGVYDSLTLVHLPGLSVYDEEIRLPSGVPKPTTADTLPCPDGRHAYPTVISDADTGRWRTLGYSDTAAINGFSVIARAFADAFPDRVLGLSLFPPSVKGIDFPNLTGDTAGYVASRIVKALSTIAPGRVLVQADNLDGDYAEAEVRTLASLNSDLVGWQSNKHGGSGAGCNGGGAGSCGQDGPAGPYFELLKNGSVTGGEYIEVWSADVVQFPQSFAAASSAGYYRLTGISGDPQAPQGQPLLRQNYPNPFNPSTSISYDLPKGADVTLTVHDLLGREVAVLVRGNQKPGSHTVVFDGSRLASGIYTYTLRVAGGVRTRLMTLVR